MSTTKAIRASSVPAKFVAAKPQLVALLLLVIVAVGMFFASLGREGSESGTSQSPQLGTGELLLDFMPAADPRWMSVKVRDDGIVMAVTYHPYLLEVVGVFGKTLPESQTSRWVMTAGAGIRFRDWIRLKSGQGELVPTDLFYLASKDKKGRVRTLSGVLPRASRELQILIEEILVAVEQLDPEPSAEAYVRSRPIEQSRLASLKEADGLRFHALETLSPKLSSVLTYPLDNPREFVPLAWSDYESLLARASHGHEVFVLRGSEGYTLSLFRSTDR